MKTVLTFILICIGAYVIPSLSLAATLYPPALKDTMQLNEQQLPPQQSGTLSHQPTPGGSLNAQTNFLTGYKLYQSKNYQKACGHLYRYLRQQTPDDVDYEWAEFFFGISLKKLGYSHAAIDVLSNLVTRKPNQRIVFYCLELFEKALRTLPVEREALINHVLCDQEYGFLEGTVSDFVHYHQGVYDWQNGFFKWGNQHFKRITPESHYYYRYLYKKALLALYRDEITEAIDLLKKILRSDQPSRKLQDDARKTLARLLYEQRKFEEADFMYAQIQRSILEQAENLLERAWAEYRMGNAETAMGLLYAFEAPSFRDAFKPEYYILKSFIYKDVCHYDKAMTVIEEFRSRYGTALEIIYGRKPTVDNHALMLYLLNKKHINQIWQFLELLEKEKAACTEFKDQALRSYLEKIYDLQIKQSRNKLKQLIEEDYEKAANDLLRYEENVHLMEYEIGLDMYKRVYEVHYQEERKERADAQTPKMAVYPFQGEFWNDELADYQVTLPNKCQDMEEWDIFFK
jgi:outer membrane protein assembly factor BamD (BamD/ComL family)